MEILTRDIEESYKIKIIYNGQEIELEIDSNYNFFIEKICKILKVSSDSLNLFTMNYNDDDGDNILLSSNEDYKLFFQQVKENTVGELIIERNDSKKKLNRVINDKNENNNSILNSNNKYINKFNNNSKNNINDEKIQNKNNEEEIPIENIIFYFRCSTCDVYPIVVVMYYCNKCNLYLCEKCEKNKKKHEHPFIKIETNEQLINIKEEENQNIEKERIKKKREYYSKSLYKLKNEQKKAEYNNRIYNNKNFNLSHNKDNNYYRRHINQINMNNNRNNYNEMHNRIFSQKYSHCHTKNLNSNNIPNYNNKKPLNVRDFRSNFYHKQNNNNTYNNNYCKNYPNGRQPFLYFKYN